MFFLGSLTHCILQPIAHRLQANCARTSRKTAICKVHGLSVSGGGKGKNKTGLDRGCVPFVSWLVEGCEREIQVCTQTQTAIFSVFTQQYLINAFIPLRRIFIKNSSYL